MSIITYSDAGLVHVHEVGYGLNFTHTHDHQHSAFAKEMGNLNWSKYSNTTGGEAYNKFELVRNSDGLVIGKRLPNKYDHEHKYKALNVKKFLLNVLKKS